MKRILTATVAAAALVLATMAAPQHAEAHWRGGGVAAGIIGGLAAGAIIGSAVANGPYYYGPGYYYAPRHYYYYGPDCYWEHHRVWYYGRWHWRRVRVCD
jgi:ABC-type Co2+ transport system permease subunit